MPIELYSLFTFHYVSINTRSVFIDTTRYCTLHSTMFLLILFCNLFVIPCNIIFTFHYVSINTPRTDASLFPCLSLHSTMFLLIRFTQFLHVIIQPTLHSTMFLLIPLYSNTCSWYILLFTFHYVSINTPSVMLLQQLYQSLHSTMFLLIPVRIVTAMPSTIFTFHYVSINTHLCKR